jgi:hypothetical protein
LLTVLGVASYKGMKHRMTKDVTGAFLIADMTGKDIYMVIGEEISNILVKHYEGYKIFLRSDGVIVVKLLKALYGLQEAPARWNNHLNQALVEMGAVQSKFDECLYIMKRGDKYLYITIFVDDLYIVSDTKELLDMFNKVFGEKYPKHTSHEENVLEYLGMKISYNENTRETIVSQVGFVNSTLEKYEIGERIARTPSLTNFFEEKEMENQDINEDILSSVNEINENEVVAEEIIDQKGFMSRVMTLLYVAKRTRPDILKEVTYLSSKNLKPNKYDWEKLIRVFEYLNYTKERVLTIKVDNLEVVVYVDASYLTHDNMKGHTGGVIMLGEKGGTNLAISRKQRILARSSTEAELIAIAEILEYATFERDIVSEMIERDIKIKIYEDNMSTIRMCKNGKSSNITTKHIKKKYFIIKDYLNEGLVYIEHLATEEMIADILTKPLIGAKFIKFRDLLLGFSIF